MPDPPPDTHGPAAAAAPHARHAPGSPDPGPPDDASNGHRAAHRWIRPLTVAVAGLVAFGLVTSFTGLPGPGPLRRHPTATLDELVDAIHADAGDLRTPDDCWRTTYRASRDAAPPGPPRPIASVDHLRSRVVVRAHADQLGRVDARTAASIERRLDAIVGDDPRFDREMTVVEASPDGWSPLMSCPLVTRGWL
jgi:hypothetical protein